jgi:hypothetical protein
MLCNEPSSYQQEAEKAFTFPAANGNGAIEAKLYLEMSTTKTIDPPGTTPYASCIFSDVGTAKIEDLQGNVLVEDSFFRQYTVTCDDQGLVSAQETTATDQPHFFDPDGLLPFPPAHTLHNVGFQVNGVDYGLVLRSAASEIVPYFGGEHTVAITSFATVFGLAQLIPALPLDSGDPIELRKNMETQHVFTASLA